MGRIVCNEIDYSGSPLVTDSTPNASSVNPVTSAGVHKALVGQEELLKDTVGFTSKNLIPFPYDVQSKTSQGITYTINNDGSITLNGTSTSNGGFNLWENYGLKLKPGDYILSSGVNMPTNSYFTLEVPTGTNYNITNNNSSISFSLNSESEISNYRIYIKSGVTFNNVTVYPMLRKADIKDSTYEQYNPSVKQVLRNNKIIEGKNLIPYPYDSTSKTENGITWTDNGNGTITANGTATDTSFFYLAIFKGVNSFPFKNTELVLSGCPSGGSENTYRVDILELSNVAKWDLGNGCVIPSTFFNTNTNDMQCRIRIGSGTTVSNLVFKPMLRKATETDPTYESYYIPGVVTQEAQNVLGAKNLWKYPYTKTTSTINNVVFTDNGDGSITVNGTASSSDYAGFNTWNTFMAKELGLPKGKYILSGGKKNFDVDVTVYNKTTGVRYVTGGSSRPEEVEFEVTNYTDLWEFYIGVDKSKTVNNVTIYPMIRPASIRDNTWVPYSMTNQQLASAEILATRGSGTGNIVLGTDFESIVGTSSGQRDIDVFRYGRLIFVHMELLFTGSITTGTFETTPLAKNFPHPLPGFSPHYLSGIIGFIGHSTNYSIVYLQLDERSGVMQLEFVDPVTISANDRLRVQFCYIAQ